VKVPTLPGLAWTSLDDPREVLVLTLDLPGFLEDSEVLTCLKALKESSESSNLTWACLGFLKESREV
jgi:hypothetical protein